MGDSNFAPWKERVSLLLGELDLCEITKDVITIPTSIDDLVEYNKKNVKEKHHLIDVVKDHLIPHVTGKNNAYEMWVSLINLF